MVDCYDWFGVGVYVVGFNEMFMLGCMWLIVMIGLGLACMWLVLMKCL